MYFFKLGETVEKPMHPCEWTMWFKS